MSSLRIRALISSGNSPIGQALTQLPQRMQASDSESATSRASSNRMPPVPLTTGTRACGRTLPIIGPPITSLAISPLLPPANSIRSLINMPKGTS